MSAIQLWKNTDKQSCRQYYSYYYTKEAQEENIIEEKYLGIENMKAGIVTKPLDPEKI